MQGTHQSITLAGSRCVPLRRLSHQPRHRFLEPIHNVKEGLRAPYPPANRRNSDLHHLENLLVEPIGIEPMTSSLQS
jgi:hypothetical protein